MTDEYNKIKEFVHDLADRIGDYDFGTVEVYHRDIVGRFEGPGRKAQRFKRGEDYVIVLSTDTAPARDVIDRVIGSGEKQTSDDDG